jgi:SAM-dependent methyltransferase
MPHRLYCAPDNADVRANAFELPFATGSLDLVVLAHVLEFSPHPHRVLREVERVLVPEGSVVISGFNPFSLWGVRRVVARGGAAMPWNGHFRSTMRIRDWLTLLGFEVQGNGFGCYAPPAGSPRWLERWRFMDRAGARWWPVLGAGYLLHGVKRVQGMRLITPHWRGRKATSKRLSPIAQRDGGTRKTQ